MNIYTLTANPSVDFCLEVSKIVPEDINRLTAIRKDAGGKGINVVCALNSFGIKGTALGFIGGENGQWIKNRLKEKKIRYRFFEINGESRAIYNIRERKTGRIYRFNESGPEINRKDLKRLKEYVLSYPYPKDSLFAICGSAPPGIPAGFYATLISYLKKRGLTVILDSDNELLAEGLKSAPDILKPNLFELSRLAGKKINEKRSEIMRAAQKIIAGGVKTVIVSLGFKGALAITEKESFHARPPALKTRSTIGAGDALLAGLLAELSRGKKLADALRMGVATGSASVLYPGTSFAPAAKIFEIYRRVQVSKI
ncbi:MAG: 1-phosphofructokinase [Candidatus Ratteibacteria bacterium]|jgi:1-phosphofructokinase